MSEGEKAVKTWSRIILLIAICITLAFIFAFSVIGSKINREEGCGWEYYGAHPNAAISNHSDLLDNPNDYELQEFSLNSTGILRSRFCFIANVLNSSGARLDIINEDETILKTIYAYQGEDTYCSEINITDFQYLGVKCPNCASGDGSVRLREETIGDTTAHVEQDNSSISVTRQTSMAYTVYQNTNCKGLLRFFLWCYIWLMIALAVVLGILIGFRRFERLLFEEVKL